MQAKTTRAFRTISEAGEELELQPHVLRFWESKFSQIKPIKRGGGRRFYRPEDIEFLRGIKILLHDEKHPIKDVQKLIRVKGAARIIELGQSIERAAMPKDVEDTVLIPERIKKAKINITPIDYEEEDEAEEERVIAFAPRAEPEADLEQEPVMELVDEYTEPEETIDRGELEDALARLKSLRSRWGEFKNPA